MENKTTFLDRRSGIFVNTDLMMLDLMANLVMTVVRRSMLNRNSVDGYV